jgi:hypothetical protein
MPCTPNPTTGFLFYVPRSRVIELDIPVEAAAKLIISAGLIQPDSGDYQKKLSSLAAADRPGRARRARGGGGIEGLFVSGRGLKPASPESILTDWDYGFRTASRSLCPEIRKDRVVARDQKVRHFIKLSTSQPAYVLLKPYCACRSITRSLLFLKADTSCSDNLFHLCRISSRMIRRLWDGGAVIAGSMVIGFAPMGGPIQGTEARFTVGDYR